MWQRISCGVASACVASFSMIVGAATPQEDIPSPVNLQRAWFKPALTVNSDALCRSLESDVQVIFGTSYDWNGERGVPLFRRLRPVAGFFAGDRSGPTTTIQEVPDHPDVLAAVQPDAQTLYLYHLTNPGCGGGCETEQVGISSRPPEQGQDDVRDQSTPAAISWSFFESDDRHQFVSGVVEDHLELYRVVEPAALHLACRIALAPEAMEATKDPSVQEALQSVSKLAETADQMAGGEGDCGTLHTASRWSFDRKAALRQALYRPWALEVPQRDPPSQNSFGDYLRIENSLTYWSLAGLAEHDSFERYQAQLAESTGVLTDFFVKHYAWSASQAMEMAHSALTNAISHGFGFYMDGADLSSAASILRAAILAHAPVADLRKLLASKDATQGSGESILDVAVTYPEALQLLLEDGADPNASNAFGKTPLMYAAQYDQPESVQRLLKAGADPNATTTLPANRCNYTIQTSDMTALHYAARYASAAIIRQLLTAGAATYITAHGKHAGYPLDWMRLYASSVKGAEHNPNILGPEIAPLESILGMPSDTERQKLATRFTVRGEMQYRNADVNAAWHTLRLAIAADSNNLRAWTDMQLVALKAGNAGAAIQAAEHVIALSKSPAEQAAAWFNEGLACESRKNRYVEYDGALYCQSLDVVAPFLRSWQIEPTAARANKLKGLLTSDRRGVCTVSGPGSAASYFFFQSGINEAHIYTLQPVANLVRSADIQLRISGGGTQPTLLNPEVAGRYVIGEEAITFLKSKGYGRSLTIAGQECKLD